MGGKADRDRYREPRKPGGTTGEAPPPPEAEMQPPVAAARRGKRWLVVLVAAAAALRLGLGSRTWFMGEDCTENTDMQYNEINATRS